jgi:ParB/RepB/Spo0J family partition protein
MNTPRSDLKVRNVGLSGIACLPQRRAVRPETVEALAQSMREIGLINPITLRPREGLGFYLIAGRHRYEAARKLKWEGIPAIVLEGVDAVDAELREIDENLIRADLSPAERAGHTARRKELYEQKHPETKKGAAGRGRKKSQVATSNEPALAFIDETAQKTGKDRSTVAREVKRGKDIPDVASLAGTSLDKGDELDAVAKLGEVEPDRQAALMERAKAGEKVSAKTELKKASRDSREAELGEKIAAGNLKLPEERYGIILCDWPRKPWAYSDENGADRSPANHYAVQDFDWAIDVLAPMIQKLAAPDCMLAFWSTAASLIDDIEIMAEAGFIALRMRNHADGKIILGAPQRPGTYRSHLIWDKQAIGMGRWFLDRHELLLIGVQGNFVPPAPGTQGPSVFYERRGEHSAKPDFVAAEIERFWPTIPKIELFRRGAPRPGWTAWGLDAAPAVAGADEPTVTLAAENTGVTTLEDEAAIGRDTAADDLDIPVFLKRGSTDAATPAA